jgi:hypothetical protein
MFGDMVFEPESAPGTAIHERLSAHYGNRVLPQWSVYKWIGKFKMVEQVLCMRKEPDACPWPQAEESNGTETSKINQHETFEVHTKTAYSFWTHKVETGTLFGERHNRQSVFVKVRHASSGGMRVSPLTLTTVWPIAPAQDECRAINGKIGRGNQST